MTSFWKTLVHKITCANSHCNLFETEEQEVARFVNGPSDRIKKPLLLQKMFTLDDAQNLALWKILEDGEGSAILSHFVGWLVRMGPTRMRASQALIWNPMSMMRTRRCCWIRRRRYLKVLPSCHTTLLVLALAHKELFLTYRRSQGEFYSQTLVAALCIFLDAILHAVLHIYLPKLPRLASCKCEQDTYGGNLCHYHNPDRTAVRTLELLGEPYTFRSNPCPELQH